eukprot:g6889.t1
MSVDRLAALRGAAGGGGTAVPSVDSPPSTPLRAGGTTEMVVMQSKRRSSEAYMPEFFAQVEEVRMCIREIGEATEQINQICEQASFAASTAEDHALSDKLEQTLPRANQRAQQASKLLKAQKEETKRMRGSSEAATKNQARQRDNLHGTLTRKFVDVVKKYQEAQHKYDTTIKAKVERQVRHVMPEATEEQIERVWETGDVDSVMRSAILDVAADPIQQAFSAASDRLQDIQKLERSMRELVQMMQDMALLVEQQGEMLDQIEYQVKQAHGHVRKGNEELQTALKHQTSLRKKKCCMLVIALICLAVFTGVIYFVTK